MNLYETWTKKAYTPQGTTNEKFWRKKYKMNEIEVYENILANKTSQITGTIEQLSERFNMPPDYVCGFLDGINEALTEALDIENLEEQTEVNINIDFKSLYKKMVEYKADYLYDLPQWDGIFSEEERKAMFIEQKKSKTFVKEKTEPGRNDPCFCGSGLKYKKCCGCV